MASRSARAAVSAVFVLSAGACAAVFACSSDSFVGPTPDAGPEASVSFCAGKTNVTFCDDFDREVETGNGLRPEYKLFNVLGTTTRGTDNVSAPYALAAQLPISTTELTAFLDLNPNKAVAKAISFSTSIKLDPSCDANEVGSGVTLFVIKGVIGSTAVGFGFGIGTNGEASVPGFYAAAFTADGGGAITAGAAGSEPIVYGVWTDVVATIDFGVPTADAGKPGIHLVLTWGGKTQVDFLGTEGATEMLAPALDYGATAKQRKAACTVRYDNVVFDVRN